MTVPADVCVEQMRLLTNDLSHYGRYCRGLTQDEQMLRLLHCLERDGDYFTFFIVVLADEPGDRERGNGTLLWTLAAWRAFCEMGGFSASYIIYCLDYTQYDEFEFALGVLNDKSVYRAFMTSGDTLDSAMGRRFRHWTRRVGRLMTLFPHKLHTVSVDDDESSSATLRSFSISVVRQKKSKRGSLKKRNTCDIQ
jgi:hypothetical protein